MENVYFWDKQRINNEAMKVSTLKLNPKNPRVIKDEKFKQLVKSIKEFPEMMAKRPMVCVTDIDGRLFPLGGNMRLKAIQHIGFTDIPDTWVMLADDWTQEQRNEFTIKDNVGFGEWDWDELFADWDTDLLSDWGLDVPEVKEVNESDLFEIELPFYIPSDNTPSVLELADTENVKRLSDKIEQVKDIDPYLKDILLSRAAFFTDFHFDKIADYYVRQTDEVKSLFRDLGLVILAPKEALEKGFIELSENVMDL